MYLHVVDTEAVQAFRDQRSRPFLLIAQFRF